MFQYFKCKFKFTLHFFSSDGNLLMRVRFHAQCWHEVAGSGAQVLRKLCWILLYGAGDDEAAHGGKKKHLYMAGSNSLTAFLRDPIH